MKVGRGWGGGGGSGGGGYTGRGFLYSAQVVGSTRVLFETPLKPRHSADERSRVGMGPVASLVHVPLPSTVLGKESNTRRRHVFVCSVCVCVRVL